MQGLPSADIPVIVIDRQIRSPDSPHKSMQLFLTTLITELLPKKCIPSQSHWENVCWCDAIERILKEMKLLVQLRH